MSWGSNTSTEMPFGIPPHIWHAARDEVDRRLCLKIRSPKIRESQKMSQKYHWIITGWWCNVPILKNDGVRQWERIIMDDISYMKWKIKVMFETTNQDIVGI